MATLSPISLDIFIFVSKLWKAEFDQRYMNVKLGLRYSGVTLCNFSTSEDYIILHK